MNNFTGDLRFLSRDLSKYYDKFYNFKNLISVVYDYNVHVKIGKDYFFMGNLNILNRKELANLLKINGDSSDDFNLQINKDHRDR